MPSEQLTIIGRVLNADGYSTHTCRTDPARNFVARTNPALVEVSGSVPMCVRHDWDHPVGEMRHFERDRHGIVAVGVIDAEFADELFPNGRQPEYGDPWCLSMATREAADRQGAVHTVRRARILEVSLTPTPAADVRPVSVLVGGLSPDRMMLDPTLRAGDPSVLHRAYEHRFKPLTVHDRTGPESSAEPAPLGAQPWRQRGTDRRAFAEPARLIEHYVPQSYMRWARSSAT